MVARIKKARQLARATSGITAWGWFWILTKGESR
jgi:hypothetical protein